MPERGHVGQPVRRVLTGAARAGFGPAPPGHELIAFALRDGTCEQVQTVRDAGVLDLGIATFMIDLADLLR